RILEREGAQVRSYDGGQNEIYEDLRLGRTDAVLLDEPIAHYYGDLEEALERVPGDFGEVRYVMAVRLGDEALRAELDGALAHLAKDGELRDLYQRWGIWNAATARLLGDDPASAGDPSIATEHERWRAAVG